MSDDTIKVKWSMRANNVVAGHVFYDGSKTADDVVEYNLEELVYSDVIDLPCGCCVEPDGKCYHGNRSPLLVFGLI